MLSLNIRVIPGARKTEFGDVREGVLSIRLNAQPQDNAANEELICFLAKSFKTPKSQITIVSGLKSRLKRIELINPRVYPVEAKIL